MGNGSPPPTAPALSDVKLAWLQKNHEMAGGSGGEPGNEEPQPTKQTVAAGGGNGAADALGGAPLPVNFAGIHAGKSNGALGGAPAYQAAPGAGGGGAFVPQLENPAAPKLIIDVNETVTLKLKISNWSKAPRGTKISWGESTSGDAIDIDSEHHDGEGSVKVTGLAAGEGTVRAEVKIGEGNSGRNYRFADTVFAVRGVSAANFVPDLDIPSAPRLLLGVGQSVPLKLKIRNWGALPKGTGIEWRVTTSGKALELTVDSKGGEATVTVAATATGEETIEAEVKIGSGAAQGYRFADTVFVVKGAGQVVDPDNPDPDGSKDQGGIATVTDLEHDLHELMQDWRVAANNGVNQFVTDALNKRINDLASGSMEGFLETLLGNIIWAAASLGTGGGAFALALSGVTFVTLPTIPKKVDQAFIPEIQKAMFGQIDAVFAAASGGFRNNAQALVNSEPGMTRYHALALFVEANFGYRYVSVSATFTTPPKLNAGAIATTYADLANRDLEKALAAEQKRKDEERIEYWKNHAHRQPGEV